MTFSDTPTVPYRHIREGAWGFRVGEPNRLNSPRVAPHELNGPRRCGAGAAPLDGKGKIGGPPPGHRPAPSALEVVLL